MQLRNGMTQERQRDVPTSTNFRLEGYRLHAVRGAWISFVLVELLVLLLTLVATSGQGLAICPFIESCAVTEASAQALQHIGIASTSYATYNLVLGMLQSLVFLSVGGFIFWRKSREPVALAASFFFVSAGLSPYFPPTTYPLVVIFSMMWCLCVFTALGYFLVTFPDGRFVPRWSWLLVVLWLVQALFNVITGPYNINSWPPLLSGVVELLIYGGTLGVLIYRYVRVFRYAQQQQAKWLLFGFGGLLVLVLLYSLFGSLVPALAAPDSLYQLANGTFTAVVFLFVPLSVAIAILRSRLWDIDILVRRTLVYSSLTVILALLYVGLVFALGDVMRSFFGQQRQNPLVIVASTLVIAALFQPLRHGVQRVIDRLCWLRSISVPKRSVEDSFTLSFSLPSL